MSQKQPGESFVYSVDNIDYLATVINTFTDENGDDIATLSLSGTDRILKVENDFE